MRTYEDSACGRNLPECRRKARGYAVADAIPLKVGQYDVLITRKRIKNLYLRVSPQGDTLSVSAPLRITEAEIARFVLSRADWIERQLEKRGGLGPRRYEDGEEIPFLGKRLTLRVLSVSGRGGAEQKGDTLVLRVKRGADASARKKAIDAWYRAALYEAAGAMLPAVERTVGKHAGELRVRDMKTRWGTCNVRTANVTINLRLAEKPAECLRYVLTHELCHLHEPGHGERFWRRMDAYYPDWKRVRKLLKTR